MRNDHSHTWWSDGFSTLLELLLHAKLHGLTGIAVTDHDTVKAWGKDRIKEINSCIRQGIELRADGTILIGDKVTDKDYWASAREILRPEAVRSLLGEFGLMFYALGESYVITPGRDQGLLRFQDIDVVKGVEVSTYLGKRFHITGLCIDRPREQTDFEKKLEQICEERRTTRLRTMLDFLGERWVDITLHHFGRGLDESKLNVLKENLPTEEEVLRIAPHAPSRLTLSYLLSQRFPSLYGSLMPDRIMKIYFQEGSDGYLPIEVFTPREAIHEIRQWGGSAHLAHPPEGMDSGLSFFSDSELSGLAESGALSEEDIKYMEQHGLLGLFKEWGLQGVENEPAYARKYHLPLIIGTDFHGVEVRPGRSITPERDSVKLERLLKLTGIRGAHNRICNRIRTANEFRELRRAQRETKEIVKGFSGELSEEQKNIVAAVKGTQKLRGNLTLEGYLDFMGIYECSTPFYRGTVIDMSRDVEHGLQQMMERRVFVGREAPGGRYSSRFESYLGTPIGNHTRKDLLLHYAALLHNIGKPLTFSVRVLERPEAGIMYETVFPQHDTVGWLLLGELEGQLRKHEGLSFEEIGYVREITRYHVGVHEAVYRIMDVQANGRLQGKAARPRVQRFIREREYKPDIIIDSLLLIKAAGRDSYHSGIGQGNYRDYMRAIDLILRSCIDYLQDK